MKLQIFGTTVVITIRQETQKQGVCVSHSVRTANKNESILRAQMSATLANVSCISHILVRKTDTYMVVLVPVTGLASTCSTQITLRSSGMDSNTFSAISTAENCQWKPCLPIFHLLENANKKYLINVWPSFVLLCFFPNSWLFLLQTTHFQTVVQMKEFLSLIDGYFSWMLSNSCNHSLMVLLELRDSLINNSRLSK